MGLFKAAKEQFKKDLEKGEAIREKVKELNEQGIACCPKCASTSVQPLKKGFGLGKAAVGGLLLGPVGLLAGAVGKNKVEMYCAKCGNKYTA